MAAGTAELLVPDGDGDEERGVATAEMHANVPGVVDYQAAEQQSDAELNQTYVDEGLMRLQDYLTRNISTAAIYEHVREAKRTGTSVFDKEQIPAQRAKSLPVGRAAMRSLGVRPSSPNGTAGRSAPDSIGEPAGQYLG